MERKDIGLSDSRREVTLGCGGLFGILPGIHPRPLGGARDRLLSVGVPGVTHLPASRTPVRP